MLTIEEYMKKIDPLIKSLANKWCFNRSDFMDIYQEGAIGAIEAHGRYDASFGTTIEGYAWWWIRKRIAEYCYKQANFYRHHRVGEVRTSEEEFYEITDTNSDVESYLKSLTDRERNILLLHVEGYTLMEIADKVELTHSTVWRIIQSLQKGERDD